MSAGWIVAIVLGIGAVAYFFAAQRARVQRDGIDRSKQVPHSLPTYHGWLAFIFATLPALLVFLVLSSASGALIENRVHAEVATHISDPAAASLSIGIVRNASTALSKLDLSGDKLPASYAALRDASTSSGVVLAESGEDYMVPLAASVNAESQLHRLLIQGLTLLLSLAGAAFAYSRIKIRLRARNQVERVVLWSLVGASSVAILTTVGIVLSMLGETIHFFSEINPLTFFFGTVWDPRFAAAGWGARKVSSA